MDLSGKVAVVTGASRGLGAASARALAQAGAVTVLAGRDVAALEEVAAAIAADSGPATLVQRVDVTSRASVEELRRATLERFGRVDVLVTSAGAISLRKFADITDDDFSAMLDTNLLGTFRCMQILGDQMVRDGGGRIIAISSIAALRGRKLEAHYAASKGAVNQMALSLAVEWARHHVTVNVICPGYIRTPLNEQQLADEELRAHIERSIPQRRVGEAHEIGGAVVFLASDEASFVTGAVISVDGGTAAK